jgi:probable addiction module antidote protein
MTKRETYRHFDAAEYLQSEEDMTNYLEAMIEESGGDPRMIAVALGDIARAKGMTQIAKDTGLARENLYKALSADGNPEFSTIMKVMKSLGLTFHAGAAKSPTKASKPRRRQTVSTETATA